MYHQRTGGGGGGRKRGDIKDFLRQEEGDANFLYAIERLSICDLFGKSW